MRAYFGSLSIRAREDVDDLVDVLLAQAVLGAILHEALAGVDHEDAPARRVLLVRRRRCRREMPVP